MSKNAKKGDWVRIKNTVLSVGERASNLPEETKKVPLDMWANGFLVEAEAKIGDKVTITTLAERQLQGVMVEIMPLYEVNYGVPQPELLSIGPELRAVLKEGHNG
jgi:hypothetical protein